MKRRRVTIEATGPAPVPERTPLAHEQVAQARSMMPKTSAHDVAEQTPCATCGGGCERSEVHWGPWRRHRRCEPLMGYEPSRIEAACKALAIPLESDADLVPFAVPNFFTVHTEPAWTDEPMRTRMAWRHISRDGLAAAVAELPRLRAEAGRVPTTCTMGRCAWCGVAESLVWTSYGHVWHDGSPAPLCETCGPVYVASGEPPAQQWELQRDGIAQAMTSMVVMMEEHVPDGIRALAEVGPDAGDGSEWSHLPAQSVESYRWARWTRYPAYAPPEHRFEARERARAAEAAWAARKAATDADEAAKLDVYGFGVAR